MFIFARIVFVEKEEQKRAKIDYVVTIILGSAIVLQILAVVLLLSAIIGGISGAPIDPNLITFGAVLIPLIGIFFLFGGIIGIAIPILIEATRGRRRIPEGDPYYSNYTYLIIMAVMTILVMIFAIPEVILVQNGFPFPNIATLFTWTPGPVLQYASYRGFFSRKSA